MIKTKYKVIADQDLLIGKEEKREAVKNKKHRKEREKGWESVGWEQKERGRERDREAIRGP